MFQAPDWRSPDVADCYSSYDNADFAQEFLRRNRDYRRDYQTFRNRVESQGSDAKREMESLAKHWGMIFPFNPNATSLSDPAIWLPTLVSSCVIVAEAPPEFPETISLMPENLDRIAARYDKGDEHYIVFEGRRGHHRLWLHDCDLYAPLAILIPADSSFPARLVASERFYRLIDGQKAQRPATGYMPTRYQRLRCVQLLCLLDAEAEGVTRRNMAFQILYPRHPKLRGVEWKASGERRRLYRMINDAHQLCESGYRKLLQG